MRSHRTRPVTIIVLLAGFWLNVAHGSVTFSGLDDQLDRNAQALVALASVPCDAPKWRVERLYRDADRQLRDALEALGYYRFVVDKSLSFENADCWHAGFDVELRAPVLIRDVTVTIDGEAHDDTAITASAAAERPVAGSVLNHNHYESYKRSILSRLATRGYFDAELVAARVTVDEQLQNADILIHIDSGARYHFGDVRFSDGILTAKLLAGFVKFRYGDAYDAAAISSLFESLNGSGYFSSVSITAEPVDGYGQYVPVYVTLKPAKRRVYSAGIGFATDTGVQGRLGYTNRRRNDRGHQFDARMYLSQVDSELSGTYRWPRGRPDAEWVSAYGGFQRKRTDTSRSDKTTVGLRVARNRTENWLETPYIDFSSEDFLVADRVDTSRLLTPGIKWASTVGRDLRRMTSGRHLSLDLRGAHDSLLSDTTFFQAILSAKWITPLGKSSRLLARTDLGATATQSFAQLPATVRFFAGGDTSVRGYGFETIGPVDADGQVTGGKNLVTLSLEADRLIAGNWALAVFADTGSAFNDTDVDFKTGVGLGVHWYSPVGPIRFDIGHPLDDSEKNFRLHITFGPDL